MSNINLFWRGASDDLGIVKYEVKYRLGDQPALYGPIYVDHIVGATYIDPVTAQTITNTYTSGFATYSFSIEQYTKHTFLIKTIDSIGQISQDALEIEVNVESGILRSSTGAVASSGIHGACAVSPFPSIPIYISDLLNGLPQVGISIVYNDVNLTSTFDGTSGSLSVARSWKVLISNNFYSLRINSVGLVIESVICSSTNSLNRGKLTSNSSTTKTGVCNYLFPININVYFEGLLAVNTYLYNDIGLSSPKNGNNRFFGINYSTNGSELDSYSIVKVATNGRVSEIYSYSICPNNIYYCCFIGGTKITMSDMSLKNIEDIVIGDMVYSYDEVNNKKVVNKVTQKFSPTRNDIIEILLENGEKLTSTQEHPYYVFNKGWSSYKPEITKEYHNLTVSNLEIGDYLVDFYDNNIKIVDIKFIDTDSVKTYNFTVEDNYNYYANNILVHNKAENTSTEAINCIAQADNPLVGG